MPKTALYGKIFAVLPTSFIILEPTAVFWIPFRT